ncbi:MAG TPA: DUF2071 domain-containing protein [Phycisphaerae bacterium]|nr:DUF2071 domain-containing protein [Phycisphaerae bacterium]
MLQSEWKDVLAIHFRVPQATLDVSPFEPDFFCGAAYVSVFVLRMCHTRPTGTGSLGEMLVRAVIPEPTLNIRTYVRHKTRPGIFFLGEWMPSEIGASLARMTAGLPFYNGHIEQEHDCLGQLHGRVVDAQTGMAFSYEASVANSPPPRPAEAGSLDEFLMERDTAFIHDGGLIREQRVEHPPWQIQRAEVKLIELGLLRLSRDWLDDANLVGAHFAPGSLAVEIEAPRVIEEIPC